MGDWTPVSRKHFLHPWPSMWLQKNAVYNKTRYVGARRICWVHCQRSWMTVVCILWPPRRKGGDELCITPPTHTKCVKEAEVCWLTLMLGLTSAPFCWSFYVDKKGILLHITSQLSLHVSSNKQAGPVTMNSIYSLWKYEIYYCWQRGCIRCMTHRWWYDCEAETAVRVFQYTGTETLDFQFEIQVCEVTSNLQKNYKRASRKSAVELLF